MKIMKYLFHPLKILVYLVVILSLIYFRSVIFLPNINQSVDTAQQFIEDKLDITIPVYVNKNAVAEVEDKIEARTEIAETDLCVSDSVVLSDVTSDVVDDVYMAEKSENDVVEKSLEVVVVDNDKPTPTIDMLAQLEGAINDLSSKVDKLFDAAKSSVNEVIEAPDNTAPLLDTKTRKPSDENLISEESTESNDVKTNVHLTADAKRLFYVARQTYWMGDASGAEKLYLELAVIENDNPDIYGELGNVYYTQGKWQDAGKAYYEAAIRLLDLNRNNQVNYLLRVIQGLDSDSAEKLKQKLSS